MSFLNNRNAFMCAFNETIGKKSQLEGNTFKISINETIEIIKYLILEKCYTTNIKKEMFVIKYK